eukprot:TRINITY_DN35482_c0_g1_i1.p1 TRINITY_DN35482_c0_g1~~TRINITY_DN35482_c0_g1_i1.p1  ORF type:complete len:1399 (-),score=183.56 TRINITY_DN35482_c0_g1_i1:81-4277(-)
MQSPIPSTRVVYGGPPTFPDGPWHRNLNAGQHHFPAAPCQVSTAREITDWTQGYSREVHGCNSARGRTFKGASVGTGSCGQNVAGTAEMRTVPSQAYQSIRDALAHLPAHASHVAARGGSSPSVVPTVIVRVLPGTYYEQGLSINAPVIITGTDAGLPTIRLAGPEGIIIGKSGGSACVLRKLRLCSMSEASTLRVIDASPLVEACELIGMKSASARGTSSGILVEGPGAKPVVRGCCISGHSGSGVCFSSGAGGLLMASDVSRCGCGVWLESEADPLVWRNTFSGHRGAGVVIRSDSFGRIMGNTVLRNGAGGILVESNRRTHVVLAQNRVWANAGCDFQKTPASPGFCSASEAGALLLSNIIGHHQPGAAGVFPSAGTEPLAAMWPKRQVASGAELLAAVRGAPLDRIVIIEFDGCVELEEPLVIDRPVVLAGVHGGTRAELHGTSRSEAVVVVVAGGESAALWKLRVCMTGVVSSSQPAAGASCVHVVAGRPMILDCDLDATTYCMGNLREGGACATSPSPQQERPAVLTHAFRASGAGSAPLLSGCSFRGSTGSGLLIDNGATATLLQCEVSGHHHGGIFVGNESSIALEGCEVCKNGHFGVVLAPHARGSYAGRSTVSSNSAGSIWHCGRAAGGNADPSESGMLPSASGHPCLRLDQCAVAGVFGPRQNLRGGLSAAAAPAVLAGAFTCVLLWETSFADLENVEAAVRTEAATARVVIAGDYSNDRHRRGLANSRENGVGGITWMDVSGFLPSDAMDLHSRAMGMGGVGAQAHSMSAPGHWGLRQGTHHGKFSSQPGSPGPGGYFLSPRSPPTLSPMEQHRHTLPRASADLADNVVGGAKRDGSDLTQDNSACGVGARNSLRRSQCVDLNGLLGDPGKALSDELVEWSCPVCTAQNAAEAATCSSCSAPRPARPSALNMSPEPSEATEVETREHAKWVHAKMAASKNADPSFYREAWGEQSRKMLYEVLLMLCPQHRCSDVLDVVGLGGPVRVGDSIYLRGHAGRWIAIKGTEVVCNKADRATATAFIIEGKPGSTLKHGSKVAFRVSAPPEQENGGGDQQAPLGVIQRLCVNPTVSNSVRIITRAENAKCEEDDMFAVQVDAPGTLMSGMPAYIKSLCASRIVDVEGEAVRARTQEKGTLQRIAIEKIPSELPTACAPFDLKLEQKAWLLRRGVMQALVEKQSLAQFLSSHKAGSADLLKAYTRLWEEEWRAEWATVLNNLGGSDDGSASPAGRSGDSRSPKRPSSRPRSRTRDWIMDIFSGISHEDKVNGDMFMSAMRSFFAMALRMSQLEADPVMRVIEAFADALVSDEAFLQCFTPSMLPEKERKNYRTPDEVIFGLTYTTLMLNTDMHNKQVAHKTWDSKKFAAAGKGCSVTGGVMMQVFKNVQKEQL